MRELMPCQKCGGPLEVACASCGFPVNSLPAYEAAVEALEEIAASPDGDSAINATVARKALRHLQEQTQ